MLKSIVQRRHTVGHYHHHYDGYDPVMKCRRLIWDWYGTKHESKHVRIMMIMIMIEATSPLQQRRPLSFLTTIRTYGHVLPGSSSSSCCNSRIRNDGCHPSGGAGRMMTTTTPTTPTTNTNNDELTSWKEMILLQPPPSLPVLTNHSDDNGMTATTTTSTVSSVASSITTTTTTTTDRNPFPTLTHITIPDITITIPDIQSILNLDQYPIGTFTTDEYNIARIFFYSLSMRTTTNIYPTDATGRRPIPSRHDHPTILSHPDRIMIGWQLYERLLQEIQYYGKHENDTNNNNMTQQQQEHQMTWICDFYQTIIPLLKEWKQTCIILSSSSSSSSSVHHHRNRYHTHHIPYQSFSKQEEYPTTIVPVNTVLQILKRCEGLYLLQSSPEKHWQSNSSASTNTTIKNHRSSITDSYYFWNNSVIVPLLLEMILWEAAYTSQPHCSPVEGEKFLVYVQKRQRQLENSHNVDTFPTNNENLDVTRIIDHTNPDRVIPSPESASPAPHSESTTTAVETTTTTNNMNDVLLSPTRQYQFPTEPMCQQLLHAWVRWGSRRPIRSGGTPIDEHASKNRMAIRHVQTLMSKMIHQYHLTPSIQYYNALFQLYAQSSPTSAIDMSMLPSSSSHPPNDLTTTPRRQRRVGSTFGREHRHKIRTTLQTMEQLPPGVVQPTLETWYQIVHCYCNWNCFFDAQNIVFQKMIPSSHMSIQHQVAPTTETSVESTVVPDSNNNNNNNNNNSENHDAADNNDKTTTNTNDHHPLRVEPTSVSTTPSAAAASPPPFLLVDMACHHIVMGYCRLMKVSTRKSSLTITKDQKRDLLQQLTTFVESLQQLPPKTISRPGWEQIYDTLMDVCALEGNITQLESLIEKMQSPNIAYYGLLIKAYGIQHRPERGEEILHTILLHENSQVHPTMETFNTLINAWAVNPTLPNAPNRALAIIRFMDHNIKCIQLGLQPDTVSFNTYLKCLAAASASPVTSAPGTVTPLDESSTLSQHQPMTDNMGRYVESILMEMEQRFKAGNRSVLPDAITYNVAIQCCANVGDTESALALLQRMRNFSISPNIRTYNTILAMYAQLGTSNSAQMAEEQILSLWQLSRSNPSIRPDVFSFNHLYKAWSKSGDAQLYDRIWLIYERMRSQEFNIQPDMVMYTFLISTLSSSPNVKHLEYATALLDDMEQNHCFDAKLRPDSRHYLPIINAHLNHIHSNNRHTSDDLNIYDNTVDHVESRKHVSMASQVMLRFIESHMRGRTGFDAPKQETIHAIVKGYVQTLQLVEGMEFLDRIVSYRKDTTKSASTATKSKTGYYRTPIQPNKKCFQELETAFLQCSTRGDNDPHELSPQQYEYYVTKLRNNLKYLLN